MVRRILVANRGEIAVRILATCQRLGIETVLAASEADLDSVPARLADRTICLGPPPPAASYLSIGAVVAAAAATGCDAIHPGYGFLSENPGLARACAAAGLVFIGPPAAQLELAGDKLAAREQAAAAGQAAAEARAAFGDPRIYLERFVPGARHVEVQLLGDGERVIHLSDRDCSIQRRYQKVVEEAPAPLLEDDLRAAIHAAAVAFGARLRYRGLGTVEFLVDPGRGAFYFLEMNARIQVEHPVTEEICGLDLVAGQIALAEGGPLPLAQEEVTVTGHAIECRICAEDGHGRPAPGTVTRAVFPAGPGIRVDTWIQAGSVVPYFYDSLLAKLIVTGAGRAAAVRRLRRALAACEIDGVAANLPLLAGLAGDPGFAAGGADTGFWARVTGHAAVAAHG